MRTRRCKLWFELQAIRDLGGEGEGWFRTTHEVHQPSNISPTYDKGHRSRQQSHEPPFHKGHPKAGIHLLQGKVGSSWTWIWVSQCLTW